MSDSARFFIGVVPGLETVAYLELCQRLASPPFMMPSPPEVQYFKGGLEVELPLSTGLALNYYLRMSNRILLRAQRFHCPHIRVFLKSLSQFPWATFFSKGASVQLHFSSKSSKLSVKKQILRELAPQLRKNDLHWSTDGKGSGLYIRLFRDECEVSVDTTGARGQFRGQDKKVGAASLRDTTAAGLLRILFQGVDPQGQWVVDPMAGSGTFLLETLQYNQPLTRAFDCQAFPAFDPRLRPSSGASKNLGDLAQGFRVYGVERDQATAKKGLENLKDQAKELWRWEVQDYRQVPEPLKNGIMVINPPWGKRIPVDQDANWLSHLLARWQPRRLGMLWHGGRLPEHKNYRVYRHHWIENSGLRNQFAVLLPVSGVDFS